jgi:hypothetical protein
MSELHDPFELPDYIGGDVAPADLWGAAPERGAACKVIDDTIDFYMIGHAGPPPSYMIVDALIEAGLLANETGPGGERFLMENRPRADLIRRVKAYQAEQKLIEQILAEALDYPTAVGHYVEMGEREVIHDTAETLAMKVRTFISNLPPHLKPKGKR